MTDPLTWDGTAAHSDATEVWLTHKHGSQWALVVDIDDSWYTVGVGCASRCDLSTLVERSSLMKFEKLSPKIYGHSIVIDGKEFS